MKGDVNAVFIGTHALYPLLSFKGYFILFLSFLFDKYSVTMKINSTLTVLEKRMGLILYHSDQSSTNLLKDVYEVLQ